MTALKPPDFMRGLLSLVLLGAFQVALFWLFQFEVPKTNRDLVVFMLGQLSGFTGAGVAYYLGTSKSSADKNDIIRQAPPPPARSGDRPPARRPMGDGCANGCSCDEDLPEPEFGNERPMT